MDVTRRNFRLVADDFDLLLPTCRFITLNEETSGIKWSKETEFSSADTVQQRYLKMRVISTQYKIIQIGVCLFHDNPAEPGAYIARPYNFYVFPGEGVSDHMAQISMEESSVTFNKRHGLDFNKWIYDGIPYVDAAGEARLQAQLLPPHDPNAPTSSADDNKKVPVVLAKSEDRDFVAKAVAAVGVWLKESAHEREYLLPDCIPLVRRALFDEIERAYPSVVVENRATDDPWRFVGVVMRLTAEEKAARPNRERLERLAEFDDKRGFRRIFRAIADAKKPLIGHNIVYDLLFMLSHFDGFLPTDEETFRERLHSLFPLVFDTKYIIQAESFLKANEPRLTLSSTSLVDVYSAIKAKVDKSDVIPVTLSRGFEAYRDESQVFHEAAFDAYAAGVVFVNTIHGNEQPFLPSPTKQLFGDFSPDELKKLGDFCGAGWHQFDDDTDGKDSSDSEEDDVKSRRGVSGSGFTVGWPGATGQASTNPMINTAAQMIVDEINSKNAAATATASTPDPFASEHKRLGAHSREPSAAARSSTDGPRIQPNAAAAPVVRRVERIERRPRVVAAGEWEVVTSLGVGPYPITDEVTGEEIWLKLTLDVRRGDDVVEYDEVTVVEEIVDGIVPPISTGGGILPGAPSAPATATLTPLSPSQAEAFRNARIAAAASLAGGSSSTTTTTTAAPATATTESDSRRGSASASKVNGMSNGESRRDSATTTGPGTASGSASVTPRGSILVSNDPAARAIEEQLRLASSVRTLTAQGADGFRSSIIDLPPPSASSASGATVLGSVSEGADESSSRGSRSGRTSLSGDAVPVPPFPASLPPPTFKSTFPDLATPRTPASNGTSTPPVATGSSSTSHSRAPSSVTKAVSAASLAASHSRAPSTAVATSSPAVAPSAAAAAVSSGTSSEYEEGSETDTDDDAESSPAVGEGVSGNAPLLSPKKKRRPRRPKGFLGDTPMKMPKGQMMPGEVPAPVLTNVPWAQPSTSSSSSSHGHHADSGAHDGSHHGGVSHAPNTTSIRARLLGSRAPLPPPPPPPPAPQPEEQDGDHKVPHVLAASLAELDLPGHEAAGRERAPSHNHGPGAPIPAAAHHSRQPTAAEQMPPPAPRVPSSQPGSRRGSGVVPPAVPVTVSIPSSSGSKSTAVTPKSGVRTPRAGSRRPSQVNPDAAFYAAIITKAHHVVPPEIAAELKAAATTPRPRKAPKEGALAFVGATVLIRNTFGKHLVCNNGRLEMTSTEGAAQTWKLEPVPASEYPNAVFITNTQLDIRLSALDDRQSVQMSHNRDTWETFKIVPKMAFTEEEKEAERRRAPGAPQIFFLRSHHRTNLEQNDQGELTQSQSEGSGEWSYPEEEFTFVMKIPPPEEPDTPPAAATAVAAATTTSHSRGPSAAAVATTHHDRAKSSRSPVEVDGVRLDMKVENERPEEVKMSLTDLPPLPQPIRPPSGPIAETPRTQAARVDREESDRVWEAYLNEQKEASAREEQKARDAAAAKLAAEQAAAAGALGLNAPAKSIAGAAPASPTAIHRHTHTTVEAEVNRAKKEAAEREALEKQKRDSEAGALASALLAAQAEQERKRLEDADRQAKRDDKRRVRRERREQRQREREERRVWELNEMSRRNKYLHRAPIDFMASKMKNLCPLPRSLYSFNLEPLGDHPLVDDGIVYVLSRFSRGFRTTDLMDAFGNDVRPTIRWIDDYSAFAVVHEREKAEAAFEHVKRSELMTIQTLEQFQAQRAAMIMEPLLRLATAPIGVLGYNDSYGGAGGVMSEHNRSRARTLAKSPPYPSHFPGSPLGDKLRHMSRTDRDRAALTFEDKPHDDVHIDITTHTGTDVHPLIEHDVEFKPKPFKIGLWALLFIVLGVGIFAAGVGWTIGKSGRT